MSGLPGTGTHAHPDASLSSDLCALTQDQNRLLKRSSIYGTAPFGSGAAQSMPSIRSLRTDVFASALVAAAEAGQLEELQLLLAKGHPDAQTVVRLGKTASGNEACLVSELQCSIAEWQYSIEGSHCSG